MKNQRKNACNLIILPYLINIKKLSIEIVTEIVYDYFKGHISKNDIQYHAMYIAKKGILPYNLIKMKINDPELYEIVRR